MGQADRPAAFKPPSHCYRNNTLMFPEHSSTQAWHVCAENPHYMSDPLLYKRGLWRDWPPPNQVTSTCRHQASHVECIVGRLIEDFDWTTSRYFSCASSPGHEITRRNVPVTFSPWWKSARSQGCPLHVSGVGTVISCIGEHRGTTDLASTHPACLLDR